MAVKVLDELLLSSFSIGFANANIIKASAKMRSSNNFFFLMTAILLLCSVMDCKNRFAEKRTRVYFLRLNKCSRIGINKLIPATKKKGYKKFTLQR